MSGYRITGNDGSGFRIHPAYPAIALKTIAVATTGIALFQEGFAGPTGTATIVSVGAVEIASNSTRRSPVACHRDFGFFARHRRRTSAMRGFNLAGKRLKSG